MYILYERNKELGNWMQIFSTEEACRKVFRRKLTDLERRYPHEFIDRDVAIEEMRYDTDGNEVSLRAETYTEGRPFLLPDDFLL